MTLDSNTIPNDCGAQDGGTGRDDFGSREFSDATPTPIPVPATGLLLLGAPGDFGLLRAASRKSATHNRDAATANG